MDVKVNVISNSFSISWKPPPLEESNGEIMGYEISLKEVNSESWAKKKIVKGRNRTSYTWLNLKYHTVYEIIIKAFNKVGIGPSSHPVQQITTQAVPSESPQKIGCVALSPQSLRVAWEPPPQEHHNGIIRGYKIHYKIANPDVGTKHEEMRKQTISTEANLNGLWKFTNYSVKVLAYTDIGDGVKSRPVYCLTAEDIPSPVSLVKALVMTSDSILVTWRPPSKPNGYIRSYSIYVEHPNRKVHKETLRGHQNLRYIYRNLKEYQPYIFWVTASTNVGESLPSQRISQTPVSRAPARVVSFSSQIFAKVGTRISLDCSTVGMPSPGRTWHSPHTDIVKYVKNTEPVIWLGPLMEKDGGNYTCEVENIFGTDAITYNLVILSVPSAPQLYFASATVDSLSVYWKNVEQIDSQIIGYVLNYGLKDSQSWEKIELDSDEYSYRLQNLRCGSAYEIYIQSVSTVGYSKPSQTLTVSTIGEVPGTPSQQDIMNISSVNVTLYLDNWPYNECPILNFEVTYKSDEDWIRVQPKELPPETVVISHLNPATKYTFRITAVSEAGITRRDYVLATRTNSGEIIPIELTREPETKVLTELNTIIPVVSAVLCTLTIAAFACFIIKRRKTYVGYESGKQASSDQTANTFDEQQHIQTGYLRSPARKQSGSTYNENDDSEMDYEICPYATFSLSTQQPSTHSLKRHHQYPGNYDCYERGAHHMTQKRTKSSYNKHTGDNIEISCISNQETLPSSCQLRKKGPNTSFVSESDSNNERKNRGFYRKRHTRGMVNKDVSGDSDSLDTSPVDSGKPLPKRSVVG